MSNTIKCFKTKFEASKP